MFAIQQFCLVTCTIKIFLGTYVWGLDVANLSALINPSEESL